MHEEVEQEFVVDSVFELVEMIAPSAAEHEEVWEQEVVVVRGPRTVTVQVC